MVRPMLDSHFLPDTVRNSITINAAVSAFMVHALTNTLAGFSFVAGFILCYMTPGGIAYVYWLASALGFVGLMSGIVFHIEQRNTCSGSSAANMSADTHAVIYMVNIVCGFFAVVILLVSILVGKYV